MDEPDDALVDLAGAVSDGSPIDWHDEEAAASTAAARTRIRRLALIARVGQLHAAGDSARIADDLHESIRGPSDDDSLAHSSETPLMWGPLQIFEKVGRGTFGDVYRAWDARLDREVALKLLRRKDVAGVLDSQVIDEARLMARIDHPNVTAVYGAELIEGRVGIWMRFINGKTVEDELKERGLFAVDDLRRVGSEIASALSAVHNAGLIHRDVKAQNVMRASDGRFVLTDFGTGQPLEQQGASGDLVGSPLYLAPEVLAGAPPTVQSDIYSLGVLLYRLATGSYPVPGRSLEDLRDNHLRRGPSRLRDERPELPRRLLHSIERALAPAPEDRQVSAEVLSLELNPTRWSPRSKNLLIAALVVVFASSSFWLVQSIGSEPPPLATVFRSGDWLQVTAFDNTSGTPVFDDALPFALERHLLASQHMNVVGQERVNDALMLLGLPLGVRPSLQVAQQIVELDRVIRILITGRVEKTNNGYLLTLELVEPLSGSKYGTLVTPASAPDEFIPAMPSLALQLRALLGDSAAAPTDAAGPVLTLAGLQSFSRGAAYAQQFDFTNAEPLLTAAVAASPNFSLARIYRAWALRNTGHPELEWRAEAEAAREIADQALDYERLFILGSYFEMREDYERAISFYEPLVQMHPTQFWPQHNLANAFIRTARVAEGRVLRIRRAELRPNGWMVQAGAADWLGRDGRDPINAAVHAKRALALRDRLAAQFQRPVGIEAEYLTRQANGLGRNAFWLDDDPAGVLRLIKTPVPLDAIATLPRMRTAESWSQLDVNWYLTLGRFADAERACDIRTGVIVQRWCRERIGMIRGGGLPHRIDGPTDSKAGESYLRSQLEAARAASLRSDRARAITILEQAWHDRTAALIWNATDLDTAGWLWLQIGNDLAEFYRQTSSQGTAVAIEDTILRLLSLADQDHPLTAAIKKRR